MLDMGRQFYDYHQRYIHEYVRLYPGNALRTECRHNCPSGWLIKKGCKPLFREFVHRRIWEDHKEDLAVRHWRFLAQKAQDSRFKTPVRSLDELRKRRGWRVRVAQSKERGDQIRLEQQQRRLERQKRAERYKQVRALQIDRNRKRREAYRERDEWLKEWAKRHADILNSRPSHRAREQHRRKVLRLRVRDEGIDLHIKRIHTQPGHCHWCDVFLPNGGEHDHITPVAKGGGDWIHNIVRSCTKCNRDKRDASPDSPDFSVSNQFHFAFK